METTVVETATTSILSQILAAGTKALPYVGVFVAFAGVGYAGTKWYRNRRNNDAAGETSAG